MNYYLKPEIETRTKSERKVSTTNAIMYLISCLPKLAFWLGIPAKEETKC